MFRLTATIMCCRDAAINDPVIVRNIEHISADFSKAFKNQIQTEVNRAKSSITAHLHTEVTQIESIAPYQHVAAQIREDNKREIDTLRSQTNWMIGGLALINICLIAYISRK